MESPFQFTDLVPRILSFLPDGTTYKVATLVCQQWHTICAGELRWMIAAYSNHLLTLIKMFPNADWNWYEIIKNPNFTLSEIVKCHDKPCIRIILFENPNITWEFIKT